MVEKSDSPKRIIEDIFVLDSQNFFETETARQCFNIVNVLIVAIDLNGIITMINQTACDIMGYEERELMGSNWIETCIHPEEREETFRFIKECMTPEGTPTVGFKYQIIDHKGKRKIIDARNVTIRDKNSNVVGVLISGEDVSGYLKEQKELEKNINLYRTLANSIPDINIFLYRDDLRIIVAEGKEMKNHGLDKKYIKGQYLTDIFDETMRKMLVPLYKRAIKGREISTEYSYKGHDYMIWIFPLKDSNDKIYAGMAVTQNITQDKENARILKKAKEEAENANRAKSEFLANISHELRTPLNAIVGFTEQLSKSELDKKQAKFVKIIDKSSEHLLSLVNEILVLSKIEAREISFDTVPFKMEHVFRDVYNALKMNAEEKNIDFSFRLDKDLDIVLLGDPSRLRQIIINMVSNAIKFTDKGYVELKGFVHKEESNNIIARIDIIDTGVGISRAKIETIFEQFKQADSTVTKKYGGTGLGLTISKKLVELQNGSINVKSEEGIGTRFTISIPYAKGKKDQLISEEHVQIDPDVLEGIEVLLVDDDSVNRLLGRTIAEEMGCNVDVATGGEEALEMIKRQKYDIILLDIHMPEISGIDVTRFIRNDMNDNDTKIIAMTAAALKEDIERFARAGMNDHLIKPYREINMYNKICRVLNIEKKYSTRKIKKRTENEENSDQKTYNLTELERMSKGNEEFVKKMLDTFIKNALETVNKLNNALDKKNWKQCGEIAHKALPSFRHLEVRSVVGRLVKLKQNTIIKPDYKNVPELTYELINEISNVISQLQVELNKR